MQSKSRSLIETGISTLITGLVAAGMNYWLMPKVWSLPPSLHDAVEMSVVYGAVSWGLKFLIRRCGNWLG